MCSYLIFILIWELIFGSIEMVDIRYYFSVGFLNAYDIFSTTQIWDRLAVHSKMLTNVYNALFARCFVYCVAETKILETPNASREVIFGRVFGVTDFGARLCRVSTQKSVRLLPIF